MAIKTRKLAAKHGRRADRRRSRRLSRKDSGEVATTAGPYRDMQREYTTALWL